LPDSDLGSDGREADLSVQPGSVVVAKEHRECRTKLSCFHQRGLHDLAPEPAAAVLRVDDHTAEPYHLKALALHLYLNDHDSGAGHEPARAIAKAYVPVFGPELQADASGVEGVLLVSFEFAPVRICQRSKLDDLHAFMQPKRAGV
jgi:hypothetical protein